MATNHTENYNLSQWEKADKVLMQDFNADNAKIDAALFQKIGRAEFISEATLPVGEGGMVTVDISNIDWGAWRIVVIAVCAHYTLLQPEASLGVHLAEATMIGDAAVSSGDPLGQLIFLYVNHAPDHPFTAFSLPSGKVSFSTTPCGAINKIRLAPYRMGTVDNNSKIRIYGLR